MRITRIGGPSLVVEIAGWRVLVDPTFDPPGQRYRFGWGTSSVKTRGPAVAFEDIRPIDLALVSHDHHADNLDRAGRLALQRVPTVVTTSAAAARLGHRDARGLRAGAAARLTAAGRPALTVTATPARHGPVLSRPVVGPVIGFALAVEGERATALWVTGDTVLTRRLTSFAADLDVEVMVVNGGGVRFAQTGPLRFTMTGAQAARLVAIARPRVVVPAHYDGWTHFRDGENGMRRGLALPERGASVVRWLPDGEPVEVPAA